jgi:hypothetical protein
MDMARIDHMKPVAKMSYRPTGEFVQSYKQWALDPSISVRAINKALTGIEDKGRSSDGKCTHHWDFVADDKHVCSIWDYKGARWSAFGPREVFEAMGIKPQDIFPDVAIRRQ